MKLHIDVTPWLIRIGIALLFVVMVGGLLSIAATSLSDWTEATAELETVIESSDENWTATDSAPLVAMAAGSTSSSSATNLVFVTVASSSSSPSIRYTERLDDGGVVLREADADFAVVYEIDPDSKDPSLSNPDPRVETQSCRLVAPTPEGQARLDEGSGDHGDCGKRTAFYVPAGSISTETSLDPDSN